MKEIGTNKLLYDRRLELGYSVREAAIRLDISRTKLNLIENGYLKVKDKKLQKRFILRYKLSEDFFEKNVLDYPSPIGDEETEDISESKAVKLFKKLSFKIVMIVLCLGSIALFTGGVVGYQQYNERNFYSEKYVALNDYVKENGTKHSFLESKTSEMLLCNYQTIDYEPTDNLSGFTYESINFFTEFEEYIGYAFFGATAEVNLSYLSGLDIGNGKLYFESRMTDTCERLHFYAYTGLNLTPTAHFSVDYDYIECKFNYNLVEMMDANGKLTKSYEDSIYASVYKMIFEKKFYDFENAKEEFIQAKKDILKYKSLDEFNTDQAVGFVVFNRYNGAMLSILVIGLILTVASFATLLLSLIVTTKFGKKVYEAVTIENDNNVSKETKKRKIRELPKNRLPSPIIPEVVIRIVAFILMVVGSMSIYYVFKSILDFDIVGTISNLNYRYQVAAFSTLGMLLIFFIKLDIIQNKKSTFVINYVLFFIGIIFYVLTLLLNFIIVRSPALNRFSVLLDFLPGNIAWGILAFNLLTSILLNKPKFEKPTTAKRVGYRLLALIPFGYMIGSSIVQIGKKAWGWVVPFEVSSLFFTKALIITAFSILYCVIVFAYRKIVDLKFGRENGEIYSLGNRYQYIKNLLIALLFVGLGLADLFIGKTKLGADLKFGSYTGIFFLAPLLLLYHPHRGPRNKKWDLVFNIAYGFSLIIGVLCIYASISVYITSL